MASTAIKTQGSIFKVDIAATLTTVLNVYAFDKADVDAPQFEVTNFASTAKEFLTGLTDSGTFTVSAHPDFNDAGQNQMRTLLASGALGTFQLELSDGALVDFTGYVLNAPFTGAQDQSVDGSFAIRVSSAYTITP